MKFLIAIFVFLALLKVEVKAENVCEHVFDVSTCTRLSNEFVLSRDVQRINLPSGSGCVLIDARQATRLRTINDGVGDIVCHNIVNVNTITVVAETQSFDCMVN